MKEEAREPNPELLESGPFSYKERIKTKHMPKVSFIEEDITKEEKKAPAGETLSDAMFYLATAFQTRNEQQPVRSHSTSNSHYVKFARNHQ